MVLTTRTKVNEQQESGDESDHNNEQTVQIEKSVEEEEEDEEDGPSAYLITNLEVYSMNKYIRNKPWLFFYK